MPFSKHSVTNIIRDAIKIGQVIDEKTNINIELTSIKVVVHKNIVDNYIAIKIN